MKPRWMLMDTHLITLILIMIIIGAFGGYLNYLHQFDTDKSDAASSRRKLKYVLLGIGSSILVPAFLNLISSDLIYSRDQNDYLIFTGFCLVAAIFSRRFITTIGDKILEAAKNAEKKAEESNKKAEKAQSAVEESRQEIETTQTELLTTKSRIEDVEVKSNLRNELTIKAPELETNKNERALLELANSYVDTTDVPNYRERVKLKSELGRQMGSLIVRNNLSKESLLSKNQSEGMIVALSFAVRFGPDAESVKILNQLSKLAKQKYTKYSILVSYDTLARNNLIKPDQLDEVLSLVTPFSIGTDSSLRNKLNETTELLKIHDDIIHPNLAEKKEKE